MCLEHTLGPIRWSRPIGVCNLSARDPAVVGMSGLLDIGQYLSIPGSPSLTHLLRMDLLDPDFGNCSTCHLLHCHERLPEPLLEPVSVVHPDLRRRRLVDQSYSSIDSVGPRIQCIPGIDWSRSMALCRPLERKRDGSTWYFGGLFDVLLLCLGYPAAPGAFVPWDGQNQSQSKPVNGLNTYFSRTDRGYSGSE
jgi:hypothetical protein